MRMVQILERQDRFPKSPFPSFLPLFLLDFDSKNDLVGANGCYTGAPQLFANAFGKLKSPACKC
jgi:hypothetical protein